MGDTLAAVIAIGLSVILMFVFPLMTMADRNDDISQLAVEIATTEFVDEVRTTGVITPERYGKFIESIGSTGNTYNVEIEVRILDENPGMQITKTSGDIIGENIYYSVYTTQILNDFIYQNKCYKLKEGDIISISAKNNNQTISQQLKNLFYTVVGKDTYVIAATHSGVVTANGI